MIKQDPLDVLDPYDEGELLLIQAVVEDKLHTISKQRKITKDNVLDHIKTHKFVCLVNPLDIKDPNIHTLELFAKINVYTFADITENNLIISNLVKNPWIDKLKVNYLRPQFKDLLFPEDSSVWHYGDRGQLYTIAKFKVQILYLQKLIPEKDFEYLNPLGIVKTMNVLDDKLYSEGKYFGELKGNHNLFIL